MRESLFKMGITAYVFCFILVEKKEKYLLDTPSI